MVSNTNKTNRTNTMSRRPSNSNHTFSEVPAVQIPRSSFNRSHSYKTTFDSGYLYPIMVDEALPGDTFKCNLTAFARMATPIYPVMDNLFLDVFYFSCPNRLLWENWEKFCGEQVDPGDSIDYTIPTFRTAGLGDSISEGHLLDYMGLPTQVNTAIGAASSLPARMYNRVFNEWFRDQNLQDSVPELTGDGPDYASSADVFSNYTLRRRGKRHDYFTSALPWPQKGDSVDLPLGTTAPVIGSNIGTGGNDILIFDQDNNVIRDLIPDSGDQHVRFDATAANGSQLFADLSDASAATMKEEALKNAPDANSDYFRVSKFGKKV